MGAELRGLPSLLEEGEQVQTLALATLGSAGLRGRLLVATDRRLILTHKYPLRPQRTEAFPYERLQLIRAEPGKLIVSVDARELRLNMLPADRAPELASSIPLRSSGSTIKVSDKKRTARQIVGVIAFVLLGYVAGGLLAGEERQDISVGDCTNGLGDVFDEVFCGHPDALYKVVRPVGSETECEKGGLSEEGPVLFPWVGDESFCARRLKAGRERG
jgi:hypothetical protein